MFNTHASSRIFTAPLSPDPAERALTTDFDASYGASLLYRRTVFSTIFVEANFEYSQSETSWENSLGAPYSDGYRVLLLEGTAAFYLPIQSKSFSAYVGGGIGFYTGDRVFTLAGASTRKIGSSIAFGIHVLVGVKYLLTPRLGIRADMRFRDPRIPVETVFNQDSVTWNDVVYPLPSEPTEAYINLDGNVYAVGLSWHF